VVDISVARRGRAAWLLRDAMTRTLGASARFLLEQDKPATVVQVTGGSSRRAMPGRGVIDRSGNGDPHSADPESLADAVVYLASQSPRAMTHELQVTPALDDWTP
jgi:hypothetical protein